MEERDKEEKMRRDYRWKRKNGKDKERRSKMRGNERKGIRMKRRKNC